MLWRSRRQTQPPFVYCTPFFFFEIESLNDQRLVQVQLIDPIDNDVNQQEEINTEKRKCVFFFFFSVFIIIIIPPKKKKETRCATLSQRKYTRQWRYCLSLFSCVIERTRNDCTIVERNRFRIVEEEEERWDGVAAWQVPKNHFQRAMIERKGVAKRRRRRRRRKKNDYHYFVVASL